MSDDHLGLDDIELDEGPQGDQSTGRQSVDIEIEQFADQAFDALMLSEEATGIGSFEALMEQRTFPPESAEPMSLSPSLEVLEGVDESSAAIALAELELARAELERTRARLSVAEARAAEVERLEAELEEARSTRGSLPPTASSVSSVPKPAGVSSRDYLDLREALNRKDKEMLDLKDAISAREKQLLDLNEKLLQRERIEADLSDRIESTERALGESKMRHDALLADRETMQKRADDLRGRLERAEGKSKKLEDELDGYRAEAMAQITASRESHEAMLADVRADHARAIEEAAALAAAVLSSEREARNNERSELEASGERHLEAARDAYEASLAANSVTHAEAIREKDEFFAASLDSLRAEHSVALARLAEAAEGSKQSALAQLRDSLTNDFEDHVASLEDKRIRGLAEAAGEKENALSALRSSLGEEFAAREGATAETHAAEVATLHRQVSDLESTLDERARQYQATLDHTKQTLESQLAETRQGLESQLAATRQDLESQLAAARAELSNLANEKSAYAAHAEQRILDLENDLSMTTASFEARLAAASAKIARDDELLERARKAMAIGLELLEAQSQNTVE